MRIVAVVLAAGGGTRFDGPTHKLLAPLAGRRVIDHAVAHAVDSGIGPVVVVGGAVDLQLAPSLASEGVSIVRNERWHQGQATSLAVALDAAAALDADAIVLALGDQPFIPADAWRLIAGASPEHQIVVASYDGRRGPHPVRLHRSLWSALPPAGDDGARSLMRDHQHLVHEVPCPGSAADIDTLEDLHRWTSS
ncbi:MAG: NTP transferase domain-containing protein [Actinobacteria bacterium]|nr:NTP transferase domain-containing protein [Actinomycetota bacterium]